MSNSPTLVTLGRLVKFCRETAGIKQAELAKMLGYSNGWLSNVETGQLRARRDQIAKIEKTFSASKASRTSHTLKIQLPATLLTGRIWYAQ